MSKLFEPIKKHYKINRFWHHQKNTQGFCFIHINKCGGTSVEAFFDLPKIHDTVSQRIAKIGLERWRNNFTFALVRNPYSRVLSHFKYRLKTNQTNLRSADLNVNEWIKQAYGDKNPRFYNKPQMFAPCFEWLSYNNEIFVDKWVKLENVASEWANVCAATGVEYLPLSNKNTTSNNTIENAIEQLDQSSLDIINDHFKIDFETFDYAMVISK